jgi:hypothetical protein
MSMTVMFFRKLNTIKSFKTAVSTIFVVKHRIQDTECRIKKNLGVTHEYAACQMINNDASIHCGAK